MGFFRKTSEDTKKSTKTATVIFVFDGLSGISEQEFECVNSMLVGVLKKFYDYNMRNGDELRIRYGILQACGDADCTVQDMAYPWGFDRPKLVCGQKGNIGGVFARLKDMLNSKTLFSLDAHYTAPLICFVLSDTSVQEFCREVKVLKGNSLYNQNSNKFILAAENSAASGYDSPIVGEAYGIANLFSFSQLDEIFSKILSTVGLDLDSASTSAVDPCYCMRSAKSPYNVPSKPLPPPPMPSCSRPSYSQAPFLSGREPKNSVKRKFSDLFKKKKIPDTPPVDLRNTVLLSPTYDYVRSFPEPSAAQQGSAAYCSACGNRVPKGSYFCNCCGRRIEQKEESRNVNVSQVQFSAVAPKKFVKGEYSTVDITVYEEEYRHVADKILAQVEGEAKEVIGGFREVSRDTVIKIRLTSPDIALADCEEEQTWIGKFLTYSFPVKVPADYEGKQILFIANVYFNDLIATKLKLVVDCICDVEQKVQLTREDVLTGFISYASQDRGLVATIIQGMKKARPDIDVFFDVESLRSGQNWEETLFKEIDNRDVLFLCWSPFAKESKWVDAEWRHAFTTKGIESIEPVPLASPDVCPPPKELSSKHFNDKALLYRSNET